MTSTIFCQTLVIGSLLSGLALTVLEVHPQPLGPRAHERAPQQPQAQESRPETVSSSTRRILAQPLLEVPYGDDPKQRMDVYLPASSVNASPVIFMVHGGGWHRGDKANRNTVDNKIDRWLPRGLIVVSVNYRMLPQADPLMQAQDIARALFTAQRLAPTWGGDSSQFILMGHSAGAHLVALLTASASLATQASVQPWLGSVLLDGATLDVEFSMRNNPSSILQAAFGSKMAFWQAASPFHQLQSRTRPMLLVCSARRAASCDQAATFARRAQSLGTRVQTLPQDLSHEAINANLGRPGTYTQVVEDFMASLSPQLSQALRQ